MLIDEDFEIPQCPICQEYYDELEKWPRVLKCGHGLCGVCLDRLFEESSYPKCPTCRETIDDGEACPKNYQLLETLSTFQTMKSERNKVKVQCVECEKEENEKMCYTCLNCTKKTHDWTVINEKKMTESEIEPKSLEDLKKVAICANCSITNHVMKNHNITGFYNLLCPAQSSEHLANLLFLRTDYEESINDWQTANETAQDLVDEGWKVIDRMNDMTKRSKSRAIQQEIVGKTKINTEKFTHLVEEMEHSLAEISSKFKVLLTEVAAENEKQNEKDCFETFKSMYLVEADGCEKPQKGKHSKYKVEEPVKIKRKQPKAYQMRKRRMG